MRQYSFAPLRRCTAGYMGAAHEQPYLADRSNRYCSFHTQFLGSPIIVLVPRRAIFSFQLPPVRRTMQKYLLAVLAIIAGTIISAKTAEIALDANGNTAKILIPKDAFTIEE
jgi:hypothetical protein